MEKQYRYPGARPFTENDRKLFFGRDNDIRMLSERMALEKLVVLFGKSGYGKTSLLQAGVIPRLRETEQHRIVTLRLNQAETNPLVQVAQQLKNELGKAPYLGDRLNLEQELPEDLISRLWCYLKSLQDASPENPWITLVFDPFEELFNLYQPHVESFGRALAALLDPRPPKAVRRLIKDRLQAGNAGFSEAEVDSWFSPLNLKVLLSLRHDHLGSLDALKQYVPAIFKHTYELKPLMGMQALEALEKPAALEGSYQSPPFTYSQAALGKIVGVLKDPKTLRIETFQLQLVAQRAEEVIIGKAQARPDLKQLELSADELGDPELIFENHYQEIVGGLARKERGKARWLVEKKLIIKDNRVPLPQQVITEQYHVPALLLNALVEKRLLRSELNSVGGTSFELSHDTLVGPIQKSARKRTQRLWRKRLQVAGGIALFLLLIAGSWGFYEKIRADNLESKYNQLRDSLGDSTGIRVVIRTDTITVTVPDSAAQKTIEALQAKIKALEGLPPVVLVRTGPIDPNGNTQNGPPLDTTLLVAVPSQIHTDWIRKLNELKARARVSADAEYSRVASQDGASDTRAPGQWQFNPGDLHLVVVRINPDRRIFDARNPKAFFVLLVDGKVFKFLGGSGYFTRDGQLAFLSKGQHLMRLGSPRSKRTMVPDQHGLNLIRDVDNDLTLTQADITSGFYRNADPDVAITWSTGSNAITEPGQQLLFNPYYLNPFDRIAPKKASSSDASLQNAFRTFTGMVWDPSQTGIIHYTVVDLTDFDPATRDEINRDIERLKSGRDTPPLATPGSN